MSISDENLKAIQEELKWVTLREEPTISKKLMERGVIGLLIPVGCMVTTGILVTGVYNMFKKDSRKQQFLMRYRIVAQGITIILTGIGMSQIKFFPSK